MSGFAVVDVETTGFAYNGLDRICEIAVVLVDREGRPEDTYTTLVNPQRDLGAQHIHHIDARDARVAPKFEDIAGDLAALLEGRVFVAHNSTFDAAFVGAEYARAGWPLALAPNQTLCTMELAGALGAPARLADCCSHFGISLADAHTALADAQAAADLLSAYMRRLPDSGYWDHWLAFGETIAWPHPPRTSTAPVTRGATAPGSALLAAVVAQFTPVVDVPRGVEYLDLLDRVLLDGKISAPERRALDSLAQTLGLTGDDQRRLHRTYVLGIADVACADDVLTSEERATIIRLAEALDLASVEVEAVLASAEARVSRVDTGTSLAEGDLIVLTGMSEARKAELTRLAQSRGLVVWPNVKKGVKAVIAQDPGSNSGKARKAREYGIPVVGEDVL